MLTAFLKRPSKRGFDVDSDCLSFGLFVLFQVPEKRRSAQRSERKG